jgi:hypothetical protein
MASLYLFVIPGRRASAGPGIQMQSLNVFLGSGFAGVCPRPGMTEQHSRRSPDAAQHSGSRVYPTSAESLMLQVG